MHCIRCVRCWASRLRLKSPDRPVAPSELTASDRPSEVPTAGAEKGPDRDATAVNDHVPNMSQFFLLPRLHPLDPSFFIISR